MKVSWMNDANVDLRVQKKRVLSSCVNDLYWDKVAENWRLSERNACYLGTGDYCCGALGGTYSVHMEGNGQNYSKKGER